MTNKNNQFLVLIILGYVINFNLVQTQQINKSISALYSITETSDSEAYDYRDIADCICDLQVSSCDQFCCCDTNCIKDDIDQWEKYSKCSKERAQEYDNLEFPQCTDWKKDPSASNLYSNQINSITCIFIQNTPYQGNFYRLSSETKNNKSDSKSISQNWFEFTSTSSDEKKYIAGQSYLKYSSDGVVKSFTVPSRDAFGYCNNALPIKFSNDYHNSCLFAFTVNNYLEDWGKTLKSNLELVLKGEASNSGQITVNGDIDDTQIVVITTDPTKCNLVNAISRVIFDFETSETQITSATISFEYVTLTDVLCTSSQKLQVYFDITFSLPSNTEEIKVSGTPGYINGKPLLIGQYSFLDGNQEYKYSKRLKNGYQINIADVDGKCIKGTVSDYSNEDNVINFGQDYQTSCVIDDASVCANIDTLNSYAISKLFVEDETLIGRYGAANYYIIEDWIFPTKTTYWDGQTGGTCTTPSMQVLTIFYAEAGAVGNEQQYIISAEIGSPPNTVWTSSQDSFVYTLQVIFVKLEQEDLFEQEKEPTSAVDEWIELLFKGLTV